eukprot:s462_g23.t1
MAGSRCSVYLQNEMCVCVGHVGYVMYDMYVGTRAPQPRKPLWQKPQTCSTPGTAPPHRTHLKRPHAGHAPNRSKQLQCKECTVSARSVHGLTSMCCNVR